MERIDYLFCGGIIHESKGRVYFVKINSVKVEKPKPLRNDKQHLCGGRSPWCRIQNSPLDPGSICTAKPKIKEASPWMGHSPLFPYRESVVWAGIRRPGSWVTWQVGCACSCQRNLLPAHPLVLSSSWDKIPGTSSWFVTERSPIIMGPLRGQVQAHFQQWNPFSASQTGLPPLPPAFFFFFQKMPFPAKF